MLQFCLRGQLIAANPPASEWDSPAQHPAGCQHIPVYPTNSSGKGETVGPLHQKCPGSGMTANDLTCVMVEATELSGSHSGLPTQPVDWDHLICQASVPQDLRLSSLPMVPGAGSWHPDT